MAAELAPLLGFQARISFAGPVDALVPTAVTVDVSATATDLSVEVTDDGVGIGGTAPRSGLANPRQRAVYHGGSLTVDSPVRQFPTPDVNEVTHLRWTIPLT